MEKPKSNYQAVNIRTTTLARIKAIVEGVNEVDHTGKPLTVSWWINTTLDQEATEAEKRFAAGRAIAAAERAGK